MAVQPLCVLVPLVESLVMKSYQHEPLKAYLLRVAADSETRLRNLCSALRSGISGRIETIEVEPGGADSAMVR